MTYDFHGSWNENTGVNAPLYDQNDSPEFSVHGCVENWVEGGAPKEKINIGWPFYGRSFLRAQHLYEPHEGNDDSSWFIDEGVPQCKSFSFLLHHPKYLPFAHKLTYFYISI